MSIAIADWADQHALDFINVYILPGRGILTINEGHFDGRPALITRILQTNDRMLVGSANLRWRSIGVAMGGRRHKSCRCGA